MEVELRAIDQIRPYHQNPRKNDAAVDAVARSIEEFEFRQPIVVDSDGVIIVGHTRHFGDGRRALRLLVQALLSRVPCHARSR